MKYENRTKLPATTEQVVLSLRQKENRQPGFRKQNQYTNKREMVISEVSIKDENILEQ